MSYIEIIWVSIAMSVIIGSGLAFLSIIYLNREDDVEGYLATLKYHEGEVLETSGGEFEVVVGWYLKNTIYTLKTQAVQRESYPKLFEKLICKP